MASRPDASGATDVTAALQRLVDSTPDGGRIRLEPHGDYRSEGTLLLVNRRDIEIDGNGARIFATTRGGTDRSHLRVVGGTGIVIRNLHITGANPWAGLDDRAYNADLVGQHGIRIEGTTDLELDRVYVSDVYGDLVYIGRDDAKRWSERVWIHDSVFARSGRQGLTVTAGLDVVIEHNTITDTRRATIDLEPNSPSWGVRNVHVLNNDIGPGRLLFVAAAGQGPVDQIVVDGNRLAGHILNVTVQPPGTDRRSGFYVVDNTSDTPATRSPLSFTNVDGLVVEGNVQPITREGEGGVQVVGSCSVMVTDNDLAPANIQITSLGFACGDPPSVDPPPPPALRGRVEGAPAVSTTSTASPTSTLQGSATPSLPVVDTSAGSGDSSMRLSAAVVVILIVGGLMTSVNLLVRQGASGTRRRTRRQNRTH